ncbi:common plant regulatory factor 1-like [Pyrus ussuriensis x Pyrus communis]|uniref:Common plant regulatory factor 1-like n=1 Tax=Pyrus ussuriensis x Pyrus communis TaxID=2448454 RepID=A0A5N5HZ93_9ROSA|nr:common plant regulatory factor 1 [Pyrus x bretschneideri]XP_048445464.1 common plant regulatory factor 1 [Pyrus x bretschneideri]KAB2632868.1 common plant regulatory factor 1-like [Pyrus ussuriensis x Pyrus communis]
MLDNMDQDVTKKLKGSDGTAVPVGYDSPKDGNLVLEASKSLEQKVDGLTDGNDGNTKAEHLTQRNNGSESMQSAENDVKVHTQVSPTTKGETNENSKSVSGTAPPAVGYVGVSLGPPYETIGISTAFVAPSAGSGFPFGAPVLDERQMKREKRKQANRESARRSRLRKQAEYEELVKTCESLNAEKMALQSKIENLKGDSETLRLENATLREKLKNAQAVTQGGIASVKIEVDLELPNDAKNIISNLGSVSRNGELDREKHESSMAEAKFHQLLESNSRTDAVAAR